MHALVTGASSGIGEALARALAARGARLTLVARRKDRLDALAAEVSTRAEVVPADLVDPQAPARVLAEAEAALGPVDLLVNNAGVQIVARTETVDLDAADRLLYLNVNAPLRFCRLVLPSMLARGSGTIVNIASLAGIAPTPGMTWYNASKAALGAASESLRGELRGTGVHVLTVYPGPVHTDMSESAMDQYGDRAAQLRHMPTGTTDVLARRIIKCVDARKGRLIYPASYAVADWFPGLTRAIMHRFTPLPTD